MRSMDTRKDVDELVASLVGSPAASHVPNDTPVAAEVVQAPCVRVQGSPFSIFFRSPSPIARPSTKSLSFFDTVLFDLAPRVAVKYDKEAQTAEGLVGKNAMSPEEEQEQRAALEKEMRKKIAAEERERWERKLEEERQQQELEKEKQAATKLSLAEEERQRLMQTADFTTFFGRTSKMVERALNESYDITIDYSMVKDDQGYVELMMKPFTYHNLERKASTRSSRRGISVMNDGPVTEL